MRPPFSIHCVLHCYSRRTLKTRHCARGTAGIPTPDPRRPSFGPATFFFTTMVFGAGKLKAEIERLENELRASQTQVQERSQQLTQSDLGILFGTMYVGANYMYSTGCKASIMNLAHIFVQQIATQQSVLARHVTRGRPTCHPRDATASANVQHTREPRRCVCTSLSSLWWECPHYSFRARIHKAKTGLRVA